MAPPAGRGGTGSSALGSRESTCRPRAYWGPPGQTPSPSATTPSEGVDDAKHVHDQRPPPAGSAARDASKRASGSALARRRKDGAPSSGRWRLARLRPDEHRPSCWAMRTTNDNVRSTRPAHAILNDCARKFRYESLVYSSLIQFSPLKELCHGLPPRPHTERPQSTGSKPYPRLFFSSEAGGIDRHRLLVAPLLHGLAEAVVWHELATRKPLVCARRAKPSLPEPVLDGTAAVGVAVQGDDWVNHLLLGDWAHKGPESGTASSSSMKSQPFLDRFQGF